jgi:hypothetical protein
MNPQSIHRAESTVLRDTTVAARLSLVEAKAIEAAAKAVGLSRSQWLRDAALSHLDQLTQGPHTSLQSTLVAEIRGLRLVIANLFLTAGLGIPIEAAKHILDHADRVKYVEAAKALRSVSIDLPELSHQPAQA